jgi:hypothetical protein
MRRLTHTSRTAPTWMRRLAWVPWLAMWAAAGVLLGRYTQSAEIDWVNVTLTVGLWLVLAVELLAILGVLAALIGGLCLLGAPIGRAVQRRLDDRRLRRATARHEAELRAKFAALMRIGGPNAARILVVPPLDEPDPPA